MIDFSDFMLKTNIEDLQYRHIRDNSIAFDYQMSMPAARCQMDRDVESKLWKQNFETRMPFCNGCIETRGGNTPGCEPQRSCPHPEYSKYYLNEFLLVPCPKPSYRNYLVCGESECCSKRHQLFKNITKRKDIVEPIAKRFA